MSIERPDTEPFIAVVRERAPDIDSDEAALQATSAVLAELGARVTSGAADRLAGALPEPLASPLRGTGGQGAGAGSDEFFAGVAAREGTSDLGAAASHVQAVFRAVADAADREAVDAVGGQLTAELRRLWVDEREGDTSQAMASGPVDPDAPNVAGPERPVR